MSTRKRKDLQHLSLSVPATDSKEFHSPQNAAPDTSYQGKLYKKGDVEGLQHLEFAAGIPPFLRFGITKGPEGPMLFSHFRCLDCTSVR